MSRNLERMVKPTGYPYDPFDGRASIYRPQEEVEQADIRPMDDDICNGRKGSCKRKAHPQDDGGAEQPAKKLCVHVAQEAYLLQRHSSEITAAAKANDERIVFNVGGILFNTTKSHIGNKNSCFFDAMSCFKEYGMFKANDQGQYCIEGPFGKTDV